MAYVDFTQMVTLLVVTRAPDPAVVSPPTGGGTVAAGTDPNAGVDLCGTTTPVAFVDVTPPGGATVRYSKVPLNVTVADQPRVQSFGMITRAVTNRAGDLRGTIANPVLSDTDRVLRGLEDTDSLVNAVIEFFLSTEAAYKAGSTPRRVFSGVVTDSEPLAGLQMRLQASDYLQSLLDVSPAPTIPQRVFTVADFPDLANDPTSATSPGNPALIGRPIPIAYGTLSDESLGLAARGVVPAWFVGKRVVDSFPWDEYVLFGHAPSPGGVLGFFGDMGGGQRARFLTSMEGVDVLWPGHAGWNAATGSSNLYRDFNGHRYTVIYARGPRSDSARNGTIPFTVNIGGIEDVGDGTGNVITSLPLQILHLLINWVIGNYQSGAWLSPPSVQGYSRVKTASFGTVKTRTEARITGGHIGAFELAWDGSTKTLRDIARMASDHMIDLGCNKDGQIIASAIDPAATPVRSILDITDTIARTFHARRQRAEIRNRVLYRYSRRYVPELPSTTPPTGDALPPALTIPEPAWETDNQVVSDSGSITKYGTRTKDLSLELTRDQATADDLAAWQLELLAAGPTVATYREGLCGTNVDLGDVVELTHFEGPTASGYADRVLRAEVHTLDIDALQVEVQGLDTTGLS